VGDFLHDAPDKSPPHSESESSDEEPEEPKPVAKNPIAKLGFGKGTSILGKAYNLRTSEESTSKYR
jgi:hypothetical protein